MKKYLFALIFSFNYVAVLAQYSISPWNGTSSQPGCPTSDDNCSGPMFGGNVQLSGNYVSGSTTNFNFYLVRCDQGTFTTSGTFYLKTGGTCGNIISQKTINAGTSGTFITYSLPNISSPTTFYGVFISSNGAKYHTKGITVTPPAPLPDLIIDNVSFPSTTVVAGSNISCTRNIKNVGSGNAGAFVIRYYLSTDSNYGTSDIELNYSEGYSSGLQGGGTFSNVSKTLAIPSNISSGNYYIIPFIDADNQVNESNEGNNRTGFTFITVTSPPLPDLQVSNVSLNPNSLTAGSSFTTSYKLDNLGGAATAFDVRFYLSTNSSYDASDVLLDQFNVGSLTGNYSSTLNRSLTVSSNTSAGPYYVLVVADLSNQVAESNESNNRNFSLLTVNAPASITVSSPASGSTYNNQNNLPISWTTTGNIGSNISIELVNATNNATVAVIADPTTNSGSFSWLIPNSIAASAYKIKVYKTGGGVEGYSPSFSISTNPNCPTCFTNQTAANFLTTGQEGLCAAQYLCSKGIIQNSQPNPTNTILREDVAKIALLSALTDSDIQTVVNGGGSFPADYFPTYFTDLYFGGSAGSYHRYAKILSYLQFQDSATPFDRYTPDGVTPRLTFNPTGTISRMDLLKVFLETWNIDEGSASGVSLPYGDVSGVDAASLLYIKKAYQLGIITSQPNFRPNDNATREEAFLILYRLRTLSTLPRPDLTRGDNYFQPANQSPKNLSVMKGLEQGNFSHYASTDFGINDIGFSLGFAHSYQSFLTLLPDEWKVVRPLGVGWSHPYNTYMFTTVQVNDATGSVAAKPLLVLAWGDGTFDVYDNTNANNPTPISVGTKYNVLTKSGSTYTVKTKSQHVYTFNTQGAEAGLYRLTSIKDRYNNTLSIAYKAGATIAFSPVSQVIDYVQAPSGRKINFAYDSQNRITNVNFPGSSGNSRNLTFGYSGDNLITFKDAKGQSSGKTTTYGYGANSERFLLKTITFPRGNKIENVYFPGGRLQWTQARDANNVTGRTENLSFDNYQADGSFVSHTRTSSQNSGQTNDITFNENGIQTSFTGPSVSIVSPANSNHPTMPASITYNGSQTYTPSYDANGNVLSVTRPDGKTESSTYDSYHNRLSHTDARNITTTFNWSNDGKYLNSISRPVGNGTNITQSFSYRSDGLPSSATNNENMATNFGYDSNGNQNSIQIPALSISSSAVYDYASRMTSKTDPRGKTTAYQFDANDNLTRETDPLNRNTIYAYDDNDNLTTITNAKNQVTTLGYDGFDRMVSETFGGKTKTYVYDDSRNRLTEFRKAGYASDNSKKFSYVYDVSNRLYANGYITEILYDNLNRMTSIKGGTSSAHQLTNFTYDQLNRLTAYTDHYGKTVGYGYDDNGNVTRIDYPGGNKLYKTYDNLNRLRTLTWNSTLVSTYNYSGSRLDNIVYGNGVKTQMGYDNVGRPNSLMTKTNNGAGSTIYAASFTMDKLGNHLEENETHPFATFENTPSSTTTYSYGLDNHLNNASINTGNTSYPQPFSYDNDGNVSNKGFGYNFNYDLEDNLTSYATPSGTSLTFEYDAFGNRRKAVRNGAETRYVLDINGMSNILAEINSSGMAMNHYIHGLGLVARVKSDGTIHYYHGDFRGSTVAMTNASQTITHKYQYDEFGNLLNSLEADLNPFRYVGAYGIMYEAPDLAYIRARYYDSTIGRFNSEDPIWNKNVYPYATNNGIMNVDLNGESVLAVAALIAIGSAVIVFWTSADELLTSAKLYGDFIRRMQDADYLSKYGYNTATQKKLLFSTLCKSINFAEENVQYTRPSNVATDVYTLFEDLIADSIVDFGKSTVKTKCK